MEHQLAGIEGVASFLPLFRHIEQHGGVSRLSVKVVGIGVHGLKFGINQIGVVQMYHHGHVISVKSTRSEHLHLAAIVLLIRRPYDMDICIKLILHVLQCKSCK